MSFNVAMLEAMQAEGLDLAACIRVLRAGEKKRDPTAAERKRRQRARSRVTSRCDPPNDIDILTPEVSETSVSLPQPWARPVGVAEQVWKDLLGNRKRKNQNNSPTAWKRFNDDLKRISAETGIPPPQLIEHAAAKGWGGIYQPQEDQGNGQANRRNDGRMGGPRPDPTLALVRAAANAQREDRGDYGEAWPALPAG